MLTAPVPLCVLCRFIPDELYLVDHASEQVTKVEYEYSWEGASTAGHARGQNKPTEFRAKADFQGYAAGSRGGRVVSDARSRCLACPPRYCDHQPGEYADKVRLAQTKFKAGDLFEAVLSQTFYEACPAPPSELYRRLRRRNPAPYGFLINLGLEE